MLPGPPEGALRVAGGPCRGVSVWGERAVDLRAGDTGGGTGQADWPGSLSGSTSGHPFTELLLDLHFPFCLRYLAFSPGR